jgi:hypothetical protein
MRQMYSRVTLHVSTFFPIYPLLTMTRIDLAYNNETHSLARLYKRLLAFDPEYTPSDFFIFTLFANALSSSRVSDWPDTWQLIKSMLKPGIARDMPFYNRALRALMCYNEQGDRDIQIATELIDQLRSEGLKPDKETYQAVMEVYFRRGTGAGAGERKGSWRGRELEREERRELEGEES